MSGENRSSAWKAFQVAAEAIFRPERQRVVARSFAILIWGVSMFIHLFDYHVRGKLIQVYVYSFYLWIPAIFREPEVIISNRFFADGIRFFVLTMTTYHALHIAFCYWLSECILRLAYRSNSVV